MSARRRNHWTIYRRLLLLGTLPALAMFLLLLLFFTQARLEDARESLFDTGQLIADNLAPAVEYPVITGDRMTLEALLDETMARSNVVGISVRDRTGQTVGQVGHEPEAADSVHRFVSDIVQQPLSFSDDGSDPLSLGATPALDEPATTQIGEVEVSVSEQVLAEEQRDILWTSAGIGLILFVGTLIFIGRLAYRLSVPIENLAASIQALPDGDFRITRQRTGVARELESLQEATIRMADRLRLAEAEREISFQQLAEARDNAEQASNAKSEFLAMMSHEIRTPLNGILGMLQLLDQQPLPETPKDYLHTARQSTEDLLVIVNDILDFSRIERGRLELERESFHLKGVIENCFASFRHEAQGKQLSYELQLQGDWDTEPEVECDPARLRQVIANLINNAIKFTAEGQVVVKAHWSTQSDSEGFLTCEVGDSGSGIPTNRLADMFNSFEQLDSSSSRAFGGTGLGLPLVQRLVELMGGHVAVETDPGIGSVFRFVVPMALRDLSAQGAVDSKAVAGEGLSSEHGHDALVVEDNVVNQRVAVKLLEKLGFHVECAGDGAEAVEAVKKDPARYSVVLMDCQMPVMDGWEATRQIRAWEKRTRMPSTPIVAMTADVLDGTERSCVKAGMNAYLPKPVRYDKLREALQRVINL